MTLLRQQTHGPVPVCRIAERDSIQSLSGHEPSFLLHELMGGALAANHGNSGSPIHVDFSVSRMGLLV